MNFTGTLRNYFAAHKGEIFDVGFEQKHSFGMIDIKTMNKILNRLESEGVIAGVSKGVYYINDGNDCTEEKIVDYYTGIDGINGMLSGDSLFYDLGLINEKPKINVRTLARYENGEMYPKLEVFLKMTVLYDVDMNKWFNVI